MAFDESTLEVYLPNGNDSIDGVRPPLTQAKWFDLGDMIHRPGGMDDDEVRAEIEGLERSMSTEEQIYFRRIVKEAVESRRFSV